MSSKFTYNTPQSTPGLADFSPGQRILKNIDPMMRGEDVQFVQLRVGAAPDSIFGPKTEAAVKRFQQSKGLNATGVVDSVTWNEVQKIPAPAVYSPSGSGSTVFNKNLVWWGAAGVGAIAVAGIAAKLLSEQ